MFSSEFCEIVENTLFYRTPPVAASKDKRWHCHIIQTIKILDMAIKLKSGIKFFGTACDDKCQLDVNMIQSYPIESNEMS